MDFSCNNQNVAKQCCQQQNQQPCPSPSVECLKVLSVICTKNVQKVAELSVPAISIFPTLLPGQLTLLRFTNVQADPNGIVMRGTLVNGKVVNSGYVPITATVSILGVDVAAVPISFNLPFQEETDCPGACPGDDLQETLPVIEAVIEPVITPGITVGDVLSLGTITFKVIIRTQITVSREKLVQAGVTVLGDLNPDRCASNQITTPSARTVTFYNGDN